MRMARIVYSLSGEGRGHATRSETVLSMLAGRHALLVYAPPLAYELLARSLNDSNVTLRRLECLRFRYRGQRLCYGASIAAAVPFLRSMPRRIAQLAGEVRDWRATHVINDFEPLLSRVAQLNGLPMISLDHQHFLSAIDPRCLPRSLAWKVRFLRMSVPMFCPGNHHRLVSSYYDFPLRAAAKQFRKVGVLLRNSVRTAKPESGSHLIAYMRRELPENLRRSLQRTGKDVFIYGLGKRPSARRLRYIETSSDGFLEHLRTSAALICSSGNQLIGEALHLGKPTMAVPERGNFEQEINGFFLPQTGCGRTVPAHQVQPDTVGEFLERSQVMSVSPRTMPAGNERVRELLDDLIGSPIAARDESAEVREPACHAA